MKKFISVLLTCVLMCSLFGSVSAMASFGDLNISEAEMFELSPDIIQDSFAGTTDVLDVQGNMLNTTQTTTADFQLKDIPNISMFDTTPQPRSLQSADLGWSPCNSFTVNLQAEQMHILVFQSVVSMIMYSKFESGNADYAVALCKIEDDGSIIQGTDFYAPNSSINMILPAGRYGFLIINTGSTYGDNYTIRVNTKTSGGGVSTATLMAISPAYTHIVLLTDSVWIMVDNIPVTAVPNKGPDLNWERILDLKWDGGSNYNKHEITDVVVRDVSLPGTYTSKYVSSNNAVLITVGAGTRYSYYETKWSTISGTHSYTHNDPYGRTTPRLLTNSDIQSFDSYIVYDLKNHEAIDFWSPLNWYYGTGTESANFKYNP